MKPKTKTGLSVLIFSLLIFAGSAGFYLKTKAFLDIAETADGVVIKLVSTGGGKNGVSYAPVYNYTDDEGKLHTIKSNTYSNPASYEVGDDIEVFYDPENPDEPTINGFFELWGVSVIIAVIGLIFLAISSACFIISEEKWNELQKKEKEKQKKKENSWEEDEPKIKNVNQNNNSNLSIPKKKPDYEVINDDWGNDEDRIYNKKPNQPKKDNPPTSKKGLWILIGIFLASLPIALVVLIIGAFTGSWMPLFLKITAGFPTFTFNAITLYLATRIVGPKESTHQTALCASIKVFATYAILSLVGGGFSINFNSFFLNLCVWLLIPLIVPMFVYHSNYLIDYGKSFVLAIVQFVLTLLMGLLTILIGALIIGLIVWSTLSSIDWDSIQKELSTNTEFRVFTKGIMEKIPDTFKSLELTDEPEADTETKLDLLTSEKWYYSGTKDFILRNKDAYAGITIKYLGWNEYEISNKSSDGHNNLFEAGTYELEGSILSKISSPRKQYEPLKYSFEIINPNLMFIVKHPDSIGYDATGAIIANSAIDEEDKIKIAKRREFMALGHEQVVTHNPKIECQLDKSVVNSNVWKNKLASLRKIHGEKKNLSLLRIISKTSNKSIFIISGILYPDSYKWGVMNTKLKSGEFILVGDRNKQNGYNSVEIGFLDKYDDITVWIKNPREFPNLRGKGITCVGDIIITDAHKKKPKIKEFKPITNKLSIAPKKIKPKYIIKNVLISGSGYDLIMVDRTIYKNATIENIDSVTILKYDGKETEIKIKDIEELTIETEEETFINCKILSFSGNTITVMKRNMSLKGIKVSKITNDVKNLFNYKVKKKVKVEQSEPDYNTVTKQIDDNSTLTIKFKSDLDNKLDPMNKTFVGDKEIDKYLIERFIKKQPGMEGMKVGLAFFALSEEMGEAKFLKMIKGKTPEEVMIIAEKLNNKK